MGYYLNVCPQNLTISIPFNLFVMIILSRVVGFKLNRTENPKIFGSGFRFRLTEEFRGTDNPSFEHL